MEQDVAAAAAAEQQRQRQQQQARVAAMARGHGYAARIRWIANMPIARSGAVDLDIQTAPCRFFPQSDFRQR